LSRAHVIDAELRAGGARRRVVIAGDHRDARDALGAQVGYYLRGVGFRTIPDAEHADRGAVAADDDRRHAAGGKLARDGADRRGHAAALVEETRGAAHDHVAVDAAFDTETRQGAHITRRSERYSAGRRRREDRRGNGMLRLRFDRRRGLDEVVCGATVHWTHGIEREASGRHGAGLVEGYDSHGGQALEM